MVWNDHNKDGLWQANESPVAGARIRLVNDNRQPIVLQNKIEPDSFPNGTLAANQNGVLLETIGDDSNGTLGVFEDADATTGTRVFRPFSDSQFGYSTSFRGTQLQLRASLTQPTSSVSIDVIAVNDDTVTRLDAYNAAGKIVDRFQSTALNAGGKTTMLVNSSSADIAYVIARGLNNARFKLDNLVVGPNTETTTQLNGSYLLQGIPTGTYQVEITPPSSLYEIVQPNTGLRGSTVVLGTPLSDVDFSLALSTWQNPTNRFDVNNDGLISALDVLVVINEINRNGARQLEGSLLVPPPYYDVDGNRNLEALDVLIVINFINANPEAEGEAAPLDDHDLTERKRKIRLNV